MSIIKTAYGEGVAFRLCERITALDEATAAYQTTGDALVAAHTAIRIAQHNCEAIEAESRAVWLTDPALGTNDRQRTANLTVRLLHDPEMSTAREYLNSVQIACDEAERAHKNAYHQMESARVAIGGYAAVLGAVK